MPELISVTGFWKRVSKKGTVMFSVAVDDALLEKLGKARVGDFLTVFKNNQRPGKNDPDINLCIAPGDGRGSSKPAAAETESADNDDLPF